MYHPDYKIIIKKLIRAFQILILGLLSQSSIGQTFEVIPTDFFKGPKTLDFRQILPTTRGTVLLATSFPNMGVIDKMQVEITQPSYLYDNKGKKQNFKSGSIQKDLYESFNGIKLIAEGPGKIIYLVSDNNHIGAVNYNYGKTAMFPPFIFPETENKPVDIRKIWIDPDGDLYIATNTDTLYIVKDATNIIKSSSPETFRLNYTFGFDPDSNVIITKGAKKIEKIFFGKGVIPCSFAYDAENKSTWVGTNYGLYAYDKFTGQTINKISTGNSATLTVTDIEIREMSLIIWFSTLEKGMGKYSLFNSAPRYFPYKKIPGGKENIPNPILDFCRKSENELFVAAGDSLPAVFNTDNETYSFINDSLFSKTPDRTTGIELDANGSLYIIKGGGFYWTRAGKFNSAFATVKPDSTVAPVLIFDVQVNERSYSELKNSHGNYELLKKITLNHNENNIVLLFSARGFSGRDTLVFAYKLDGIDNDWVSVQFSMMDERFNMALYSNLRPGTYKFRVKVKRGNEDWRSKQAELVIIIKSPFWQTWWFWTAVIAGLGLIIGFILWWRIKAVKKKEREKFAHEKQILELEAKALRAQMNPHFIFNSLNSIKSLIQQNENEKSIVYLTTFSKLIRNLFNSADKKEISLYDEMETCKLYLQLEAMRFDTKFSYAVNVDENIDLKSIQVPALIIQPFIENAIWHGIVPGNNGGQVSLNVLRKASVIEIIIDDDGIGREASAQNKSASGLAHQSKGVNLTQSRLELDNLLKQRQAKLEIIDKKDENGIASGTKVIISIKEEI